MFAIIMTTVIVLVSLGLLFVSWWYGYRFGHQNGSRAAYNDFLVRLYKTPNPEAWQQAHYLIIDMERELQLKNIPSQQGQKPLAAAIADVKRKIPN